MQDSVTYHAFVLSRDAYDSNASVLQRGEGKTHLAGPTLKPCILIAVYSKP